MTYRKTQIKTEDAADQPTEYDIEAANALADLLDDTVNFQYHNGMPNDAAVDKVLSDEALAGCVLGIAIGLLAGIDHFTLGDQIRTQLRDDPPALGLTRPEGATP